VAAMMVVMISGALASERSLKERQKWNVKMKVEMSIFSKWGGTTILQKCSFPLSFSC
jgi:hypothetical protein